LSLLDCRARKKWEEKCKAQQTGSSEATEPSDAETLSARKTRSHKVMTNDDFEALSAENIDWEEMGSENRELLRDWAQRKEQEFLDTATQCQHASAVCPIGRDRFFRSYWVFRSVPGLFVEESPAEFLMSEPDTFQRDKSSTDSLLNAEPGGSRCHDVPPDNLQGDDTSTESRPRWSVYGSVEGVDRLLGGLNTRGVREGMLRVALVGQQDRLKDWVGQCDVAALSTPCSEVKNSHAEENGALVDAVRGMVLDLEERIFSASCGSLKVQLSAFRLTNTTSLFMPRNAGKPGRSGIWLLPGMSKN